MLLVVLLQGCGGSSETGSSVVQREERTQVEVTGQSRFLNLDRRVSLRIDQAWHEVQVCVGMGAEPPVIHVDNLGVPPGLDGVTFFRSLEIRIRPGALNKMAKHEMIHYLKAWNGDVSDSTHGNGGYNHDADFNRCGDEAL